MHTATNHSIHYESDYIFLSVKDKTSCLGIDFYVGTLRLLRKYWVIDIMDPEMAAQPVCIGLIIHFFSKEKVDDEYII